MIIIIGCDDEKKELLKKLYEKLYPHYHIHFTPDYKKVFDITSPMR